ncbi:MAG: response regulator transcription factor [Alistipes sp.]|nr:response regulator transcription factor [Alistipes sp.]
MEPCRVGLVAAHALFRSGLRGLLDRCAGVRVVGEAASGEELLRLLPQSGAEVVFMDFSMPGMDGAETAERALALVPGLRIIALSMFGEGHYYRRMVEAGARGFLMKDCALEEVLQAIEAVRGGETYFCEGVLLSLSGADDAVSGDGEADGRLSGREIEILVRICRGMSNQEIADELFISKRTVDKHRANILEKTGCKNTASLVVHALRNGLVDVP